MNTPPTDPGGAIWAFNEWENGECVLIDCEGNIIHPLFVELGHVHKPWDV
jgi:hypothetical protein